VLLDHAASTSKLAEKVLDSTINIPPLIYQNHGGIVGIYVARRGLLGRVRAEGAAMSGRPPGDVQR
jgi:type IV secretory pathway VirB10-like protein